MKKDIGILWFKNDLRLYDNEALEKIMSSTTSFLPVFVLDPRLIQGEKHRGLPGMYQTRILFLLESLKDLRENLRKRGSDLIIRSGKPEDILYQLAKKYQTNGVYCNRERMPHERAVQNALEKRLWKLGLELHYYRGKMLYYTSDLPFPVPRTPDSFTSFLKEVENQIEVRHPIYSQNKSFPFPDIDIDPGELPELSDLGYDEPFTNPEYTGGQTYGESELARRLELLASGRTENLRISPWMALGNLSPKDIYHRLEDFQQLEATLRRSLKRNLILRDFYRLTGKKEPDALFAEGGLRHHTNRIWTWDRSILQDWITGQTGHDYVDACMKCLAFTGYLTHKQRKAVAYFLTDKMEVHWLLGAAYFERVLLDYDPCSNYVNWQRIAGLSLDLKGRHQMNFDLVGDQEDPEGSFRRKWGTREVPSHSFEFSPIGSLKLEN